MTIYKDAAGRVRTKPKVSYPSPVSIRFKQEEIDHLRKAAAKAGVSVGQFIRSALERPVAK